MPQTIFFSWQADTLPLVGRNLIERALERALGRIEADTELEEAIRELEIDRDTKGVAGTPPIVDTIFNKIDAAAVFLPDLTFVGSRLDGRPTPNPNVLIEYGWALKSLSHSRMVPVMNTAFGEPTAETMPFDMRHLRNPITYHCPIDATEDQRRQAKDGLSRALENAIRAVLKSAELREEVVLPLPLFFTPRPYHGRSGMFRSEGEALGVLSHPYSESKSIHLNNGPMLWLRVMPISDPKRSWSISEIEQASKQSPLLQPLNRSWGGFSYLRGHDGFGAFPGGPGNDTFGVGYVFRTGEIWAIDTFLLDRAVVQAEKVIHIREDDFRESISDYTSLLRRLGVSGPLRWIAGMDGVKGQGIYVPTQPGYSRFGSAVRGMCMLDEVVENGVISEDTASRDTLRPFFERIYESCGVTRPEWLNQEPMS